MNHDAIYASFTTVAALLVWAHIVKLARDKQVKGVHWAPVLFTWTWCCYGLVFYVAMELWWCSLANLVMFVSYTVWFTMIARYWRR